MDASIIAAPSSTKNKDSQRDPEMHQTKKGNQWHHGMKAHIGVDADSGLVHTVIGTAANVNDVTQAAALLHGQERDAWADAGCDTCWMTTRYQRAQPKTIYQLRIELAHIEPLIWRRVLVPDTIKLSKLDRVVQAAMGWTNSHLHDWHIEGRRYGIPDDEWVGTDDMLDERRFTAAMVLGADVHSLTYSYDFGDGWEHGITVEQRLPVHEGRNDWPMCLAGENACPPEDVGGPPGYMDFLQAMHDPQHEQHADYWQWWGGPFDAKAFSLNAANIAIRKLR